jgi:hypothetical protein
MKTLYHRVAGIDVHRLKHVGTILIEQADGGTEQHSREFGGFKRDLRARVAWLKRYQVELVVMESTGIYWGAGDRPCNQAFLDLAGKPTADPFPLSSRRTARLTVE